MLNKMCSVAVPHVFLFSILSLSVPYPFCTVLIPFNQRSTGKRCQNPFRRMKFLRACLQECFQRISQTNLHFMTRVKLKLLHYPKIQRVNLHFCGENASPVTQTKIQEEDSIVTSRQFSESFSETIHSNQQSVIARGNGEVNNLAKHFEYHRRIYSMERFFPFL